jgi:hypothetical protein
VENIRHADDPANGIIWEASLSNSTQGLQPQSMVSKPKGHIDEASKGPGLGISCIFLGKVPNIVLVAGKVQHSRSVQRCDDGVCGETSVSEVDESQRVHL